MRNRTVLYVEDEKNIREGIASYLKKRYQRVMAVDNCEEALDLYEEHHIDIIITDIYIDAPNRMDGLEMVKLIRKKDKKTPILITTAYPESQNLMRAVDLHLEGFLVKVFSRAELGDKLSKIDALLDTEEIINLSDTLVYDPNNVTLSKGEIHVQFTESENRLFHLLSKAKNKILHFQTIDNEFYSPDKEQGIALKALIFALRKKLRESGFDGIVIKSVSKVGYKLLC